MAISTPAVPADPTKGIVGSAGTVRWTGDMQAWIDEDLVDIVRGNQLVTVSQTMIKIPVNVPVMPSPQDLVTVNRIGGIEGASLASPTSEVMSVRTIDQGNTLIGYVTLRCVRGGST